MDEQRDGWPLISVHELAAFVFCPRAGINAYEQQRPDEGVDGLAMLDYRHNYELSELHDELMLLLNYSILSSLALIALVFCGYFGSGLVRLGCVVLFLAIAQFNLRTVWAALKRYLELRKHTGLPAKTPDLDSPKDEQINWWNLIAAGYECIKPEKPLRWDNESLIGKPWRLLRNGSQVVPVFRLNKEHNIQPQHRIRVAAYCQLITELEGSSSPFALLLEPKSYEGTAIKITDDLLASFRHELQRARDIILRALDGFDPGPPRNERKCLDCPFGKTHSAIERSEWTNLRGERVELNVWLTAEQERRYSICGDRFRWRPSHKDKFVVSWNSG